MSREQRIEVDDVFVAERRGPYVNEPPVYAHRRVVAIHRGCVVYCNGGNRTVVRSATSFRRWAADAELRYRRRRPRGLVDRLIDWLTDRVMRTPYVHLKGYMERWWLFRLGRYKPDKRGREKHPRWAVKLHHILRSDHDRHVHDHPWPYVAVILRGGYTEVTPVYDRSGIYTGERRQWYGPGSVLIRRATHWHRLELPPGRTAWTLFITGREVQEWGFLKHPDYKIDRRKYKAALARETTRRA